MRINQLTIKIEKEFNEIALIQDDDEVDITPEMVDLVCNELQKLKTEIICKSQEKK